MDNRNEQIQKAAEEVISDSAKLEKLVHALSEGKRRERQMAASVVGQVAKKDPSVLTPYTEDIIDALNRPEAQTRWECLEALAILVDHDARTCGKALPEVETALFDEESGPVRLGAMRFLCKYGATTANRSVKAWPLIDEGIQCYHGDLEFSDMLTAITDFSLGKLDPTVAEQLAARMSFDATNSKGSLQRRAQQIVDNVKKG